MRVNKNSSRINFSLSLLNRAVLTVAHASLFAIVLFALPFCNIKENSSPLYGTYRIYTEDPIKKMSFAGQDTYIRVNKDNTIIYNTTINQKPKFHFEGTYTLDKKTNTLTIKWKEGKLPDKLIIEKEGEDYYIKVRETIYLKEKAKVAEKKT